MNWKKRYAMEQDEFEKAMGGSVPSGVVPVPTNADELIDHIKEYHPEMSRSLYNNDMPFQVLMIVHNSLTHLTHEHTELNTHHNCRRDESHCEECAKRNRCICDECMRRHYPELYGEE